MPMRKNYDTINGLNSTCTAILEQVNLLTGNNHLFYKQWRQVKAALQLFEKKMVKIDYNTDKKSIKVYKLK